MKKHIALPPRNLSFSSRLLIINSHIYALGSWIVIGIGSLMWWLDFTFIGVIFFVIGFFSLRSVFKKGRRTIKILKKGKAAYGKLIKSEDLHQKGTLKAIKFAKKISPQFKEELEDKGMSIEEYAQKDLDARIENEPQNVILKYFFEFKTREGMTHKVEAKVKYNDGDILEDEEDELILYNPNNPDKAVVYDAIKNAPKILSDGSFGPAPYSKMSVLIVPLVVILMNIGFLAPSFPSLPSSDEIQNAEKTGYLSLLLGNEYTAVVYIYRGMTNLAGSEAFMSQIQKETIEENFEKFMMLEKLKTGNAIREIYVEHQSELAKVLNKLIKARNNLKLVPAENMMEITKDLASDCFSIIDFFEMDIEKRYENAQDAVKFFESVYSSYIPDTTSSLDTIYLDDTAYITLPTKWYSYSSYCADAYFLLSRSALYKQSFEESEQAARKAIEKMPHSTVFYTHLPTALVFQGKFEEAKSLYLEWKDKCPMKDGTELNDPFKEEFSQILQSLEKEGIMHPDVEKARALLMD